MHISPETGKARVDVQTDPSLMEIIERIAKEYGLPVNKTIERLLYRAVSSPDLG